MKPQRTLQMVVFTVVAIICVAIGSTLSFSVGAFPAEQTFSASLAPVAGLVQYQATGSTQWVTLKDVQLVNQGDQIRTGSNGFAHLTTVTGIDVSIFPTTLLILNNLSTGKDSGQTFDLGQAVGTIFVNVKQAVKTGDSVIVVLPNAGVSVKGTQFLTFESPTTHGAVFAQQGRVQVTGPDKQITFVTPDNFLYIRTDVPADVTTCNIDFLKQNTKTVFINVPLSAPQTKQDAVRNFLNDFLISNVNPLDRAYLRQVLGLPAVDLTGISVADDEKDLQEIFAAIPKLDVTKLNLAAFLKNHLSYYDTYQASLSSPLAPTTCGTGNSAGEDAKTCPDDFTPKASCGNGICETNRVGGLAESVISCPADCLPHGAFTLSCISAIDALFAPTTGGGGGPFTPPGGKPGATATSTFTPTPPPASGVGK